MRNLSAAAQAMLAKPYGIEPLTLIKVFWSPYNVVWYGTKTDGAVQGKILDMSVFDDVVNFDGNQNSQSFTVTLDDVDGTIKAIYDVTDIHKRRCQVYQWFAGLPLTDAFLVFDGEINSPIQWKEGDRTLTFSIVSKLEDQEVGFSPEEGLYAEIPDDLVGKPFPLIFGIAIRVPCAKLDPIPTGILLDSLVVPDPSIQKQLAKLAEKQNFCNGMATLCFYTALEAYYTGMGDGTLSVDEYWQDIGDQWTEQGNQYLQQAWQAQQEFVKLASEQAWQLEHKKKSMRIHNGDCFPGGEVTTTLDKGTQITGEFQGGDFVVNGIVHPAGDVVNFQNVTSVPISTTTTTSGSTNIVQKLGFVFESADQPFKLTSPLPVKYLACMFSCTVLNVWASRNYGDARLLMQVPSEYYSVSVEYFGSLPCTMITLSQPLSYRDKKWADDLYVDLQSGLGPNAVAIMIWLIENYTVKGIDSASFSYVYSRVANAPCNFALLQQENIVKILSDIAYQARCALLLKNDVFYLIYLPDEPAPVDTITEADILVDTLTLDHTSTENLVTKLTSTYVTSYEGLKPNKIIIRNNVWKYGVHAQATDYYIYTHNAPVDASTSFWAIRKSNTWKLIKFKSPLTKLKLEAFDPVQINFASKWVCNDPVTGIVQSVKFDPKALNVEIEVWLPVRLGEMTKYNFAWPVDSDVAVASGSLDFQKPGSDADGDLGPSNGACDQKGQVKVIKGARHRAEHPTPQTREAGIILTPSSAGLDPTPQPNRPYEYSNPEVNQPTAPQEAMGIYPGRIVGDAPSGEANWYAVRTYFRGLNGRGTVTAVYDVTKGPKPPVGSWVAVIVVTWETHENQRRTRHTEKCFVPSSATNTFIAKIVSGGGDSYQMALYPNGVDKDPTDTVTVRQMQIDEADSIPVGSWWVVIRNSVTDASGNATQEYVMQFPVYVGS